MTRLSSPSALSAAIIEIEGEAESAPSRDRRRALTLAFALCVAIGSAGLGRDAPAATQPGPGESTTMIFDRSGGLYLGPAPLDRSLSLPPNTTDALLSSIPDRLANEAWPALQFIPVRVRALPGLAVQARRPGDPQMLTWTEGGNVYWLVSDGRDIADLLRLADSLR